MPFVAIMREQNTGLGREIDILWIEWSIQMLLISKYLDILIKGKRHPSTVANISQTTAIFIYKYVFSFS